jgi:hypothetical protein
LHVVLLLSLCLLFVAAAPAAQRKKTAPAPPPSGPSLQPKLVPGDVLRYQVEFRTTSDTKAGGSVSDPEGPSHVVITWNSRVRLDVLPAPDNAAAGARRLRTTYEQSNATVQSDSPDPQTDAIVKQYQQLEGHSIEFTLAPDGTVTAVSGLESLQYDQSTVNAAQQWMSQLSAGGAVPSGAFSPGMTWSSEQNADSLPLAGLAWRTDSTYLRNESCGSALPSGATSSQAADACAVILMSLTLSPSRSKSDATPEDFRRNGLQSSGHWTGSGDSLSYVSLRTGWVVSASQSSMQEMDVNITNALGATVHYAGTVATHSQMSLLPPDSSPAAPATPNESSSHDQQGPPVLHTR